MTAQLRSLRRPLPQRRLHSGECWVITGGESGPNARPSHPDWFRSIRDQCAAAGVAYFHKQNGIYEAEDPCETMLVANSHVELFQGNWWAGRGGFNGAIPMKRVGKARAGRLLDGVQHNGFPEAKPQ